MTLYNSYIIYKKGRQQALILKIPGGGDNPCSTDLLQSEEIGMMHDRHNRHYPAVLSPTPKTRLYVYAKQNKKIRTYTRYHCVTQL